MLMLYPPNPPNYQAIPSCILTSRPICQCACRRLPHIPCHPLRCIPSSNSIQRRRLSPRAPALYPPQINLFLRVVRRREDGYHDLASLFHVIDLGDDMRFALLDASASRDELVCSDPTIPSDDSNLVIKALNLYRRKTGTARFFRVVLNKFVPHGACLYASCPGVTLQLSGAMCCAPCRLGLQLSGCILPASHVN